MKRLKEGFVHTQWDCKDTKKNGDAPLVSRQIC